MIFKQPSWEIHDRFPTAGRFRLQVYREPQRPFHGDGWRGVQIGR